MPEQKRPRAARATPGRVRAPYKTYAPSRSERQRRSGGASRSWLGWLPFRKRPSRAARSSGVAARTVTSAGGRVGRDLRAGASSARAFVVRASRRRPADAPPHPRPLAQTRPRPHLDGRRRRLHPALIGLCIAQIALVALAAWGLTAPTWQVRHIRIEGTSDPVVLDQIHHIPLTGCNIFRCNLTADARQVETLPLVARADVQASYPDSLVILVTPRPPAVLWHTSAGDIILAADGTVLGAPESDPALTRTALPQIDDESAALFGGHLPHPGQLTSAVVVEMARQLRKNMADALGQGWSLRYTTDRGFVALSGDGRQVLFGTPADAAFAVQAVGQPPALTQVAPPASATVAQGVQRQLDELRALLAQLKQRNERATLIDLRWGTHPYYRSDG